MVFPTTLVTSDGLLPAYLPPSPWQLRNMTGNTQVSAANLGTDKNYEQDHTILTRRVHWCWGFTLQHAETGEPNILSCSFAIGPQNPQSTPALHHHWDEN